MEAVAVAEAAAAAAAAVVAETVAVVAPENSWQLVAARTEKCAFGMWAQRSSYRRLRWRRQQR